MEFRITVSDLQSTISKLSSVSKMSADDITSMILIEAGEDLNFYATDSYINVRLRCRSAEVISSGSILIKLDDIKGYVSKFSQLVEGFGTEFFTFKLDKEVCTIKSKTLFGENRPSYKSLKVGTYDAKLFKKSKEFELPSLILNSTILREGIDRVIFCVNPSEVRRSLQGVYMKVEGNTVVFAGTNGVKLAEVELAVNADMEDKSYILKHGFAGYVRKLIGDNAQVFINFDGQNIYLKSDDVFIAGTMIIGESYPDYKPKLTEYTHAVRLMLREFLDNVTTALDVLDKEDNSRLTIQLDGSTMVLRNNRVEIKQELEFLVDEKLDIDVNGNYLASMLISFRSPYIDFCYQDGGKLVVFKAVDEKPHLALLTSLGRH